MLYINNYFIENQIIANKLSRPALQPYLKVSYSQVYEDIIIESLILSICKNYNLDINNFSYIDIGANHSISTNNTYLFYEKYNMDGILVDANPLLCDELSSFRSRDHVINAIVSDSDEKESIFYISDKHEISSLSKDFIILWNNGMAKVLKEIIVPNIKINDILAMSNKKLAILSIDVEGLDKEILSDIDFSKYRPMVIVIEPSDFFIKDNTNDIIDIMNNNNYTLISITDVNLIFKTNTI
jgi:FkbM family methyltransferase